ncbi:MAG: PepSY-like domain-containing protein [Lewinellaceae bacterium]|nr:PepSY-like domain-containing protein [Saprospiraceae bacterium]MCB9344652.1 PepSY-like domain-containing protein [Lewinellaceae bacterium]
MKFRIIAMAAAIALSIFSGNKVVAQKVSPDNIPTVVKSTFSEKFPNAAKAKWSMEEEEVFEVEFRQLGQKSSAKIEANGNFLESETNIKRSDLPVTVVQALNTQFAGYKIEKTEKVTFPDGSVAYELEIEKGEQSLEVQFNADGKLLKKEEEKEEKED